MGREFVIQWFGKSVTELKAIREKNRYVYSKEKLAKLDALIEKKEKEEILRNEK